MSSSTIPDGHYPRIETYPSDARLGKERPKEILGDVLTIAIVFFITVGIILRVVGWTP